MPHPLDAAAVRTWCARALDTLGQARETIDAINVYPVADADTGTNLYLTVESAAQAVEAAAAGDPTTVEAVNAMAHGALIGARGNSGTILAQLLRGMAEVVGEGGDLATALRRAARSANAAVAHPVAGTILTVAEAAADAAEALAGEADPAVVARAAWAGARQALADTPGQLGVLAEAGVVDAGGYDEPRWWHPRGWAYVREHGLRAPLFWRRDGGTWLRRRFGHVEPVPPEQPVMHVCWYEADAYARWAGRRLPTEAEWEKAARHDPATGRSRRHPWGDDTPGPEHANLGQRHLEPAPAGAYPAGAAPCGARQLLGDVWEWTASDFTGYPGFTAFPYDEYSKVFLGGDYKVLRGGAFGVDPVACRATFRNWDHPIRRQIFAGFRTARDAEVTD
ncbi:ergothioneine biosynthesis protein EgtB [Streptomyces durbertensis]|uniref:Ergothioneine biosynthesis protein EgtB n=1 Tax=Streptomyces durbertensis TaxID=2448886 RepID=A0ABR6EIQ8_9ACTN|nr:SUMF1/EgtB/PvdO family nonheme iron enzyme [Streptomyces durbertensis]MBB1245223.1 ergothioneine biosynthesis protein EgtB [Streptomyces durbertensis]